MSNSRVRRLARLQAMGDTAARTSERAFAQAIAEAANAAARLSHIEGLILTAAPLAIAGTGAALAAAAQLRALLLPAAEMAEARLHAAVAHRTDAEARLVHSRARSRRLAEIVHDAKSASSRHAHQAEVEARPPAKSAGPHSASPHSANHNSKARS